MKAIGYVRCAVCDELLRGYAPRVWKPGDALAACAHGPAGVYRPGRLKCDGSYKRGVDSRLDSELKACGTNEPADSDTGKALGSAPDPSPVDPTAKAEWRA